MHICSEISSKCCRAATPCASAQYLYPYLCRIRHFDLPELPGPERIIDLSLPSTSSQRLLLPLLPWGVGAAWHMAFGQGARAL